MRILLARDIKGRKRILLEVEAEVADELAAHMGEMPPWVVIAGKAIDTNVIDSWSDD